MEKPPIVFQLPDTGEWAVGTIKTVHPTKGAADKAASKVKHEVPEEEPQEQEQLGVPDHIAIFWEDKQFTFSFFENRSGMCIAVCDTPGYGKFFGKSTVWWSAAEECLADIVMNERTNS
jgi:hypothetical protein